MIRTVNEKLTPAEEGKAVKPFKTTFIILGWVMSTTEQLLTVTDGGKGGHVESIELGEFVWLLKPYGDARFNAFIQSA